MDVNVYLDANARIEIDASTPSQWGADVFYRLHWPGDGPLNLRGGWVYFRAAVNSVWGSEVRWPEVGGPVKLVRTNQSLLFSTRLLWQPGDAVTMQASVQVPGFSVMEVTEGFTVPSLPVDPGEVPVWTAGTVYTQPATVTDAEGVRRWALQTASETAAVGREPWQAYMWAVWQEVT